MLPPVLMAYREKEVGGFLGGFLFGGCAGVAALFTSFSLSILGPSIPVAFAAAVRARAPSPYLARVCLRVWAYRLLFLCPRACGLCVWWRWCAHRWRVAPVSRFRGGGRPSYHRFFPHGLPVNYSLIPLMFRSSLLPASCSSRVLWRCPHFLRRWRLPPALMAYGERSGGWFIWRFLGRRVRWFGGVVYFLLVVRPWSFHVDGDCCGGFGLVLPRHTLLVFACTRGHTTLALFVPSGLWFVCFVAVVCSPAACGSLLSVSREFPSYQHFFSLGLPIR